MKERLTEPHLQAVNAARLRFAHERSIAHVMPNGVYEDFRAVLNISGDDARWPEALAAAREVGVRVVVVTGKSPARTGADDGLLILSGNNDESGVLHVNSSMPSFLSAAISFQPISPEELAQNLRGFEIYDAQKNAQDIESFLKADAQFESESLRRTKLFKQFPDEFRGAAQTFPDLSIWDEALSQRPLCCIANNAVLMAAHAQDTPIDSYKSNYMNVSTHIFARELNETEVRKSLIQGRTYVSHDWLCDPTGFIFGAGSMLGTFVMGDSVPYYFGNVKLGVFTPLPAHIRILHEGKVVAEHDGNQFLFETSEPGAYRAEVALNVDGELRPWIYSSPIYLQPASLSSATVLKIPNYTVSPDVIVQKNVTYSSGRKDDEQKHQLDIYRPNELPAGKEKKGLPVLMFIHGGSWRTGDRWQYLPVGNFLAGKNIVTFIPSYRLAPQNKHPAQVEDAAAALKWVVDHCAEYGGDPERIYIAGHSAGGHITALLTFDTRYLEAQHVSPRTIKGAICLSGVYDLVAIGDSQASVFGTDKAARRDASPLTHVKAPAPRMLISCCQHDYLSLPQQARDFYKAVKAVGADAEFLYVPNENHISEMMNVVDPKDLTGSAIIRFVK